MDNNSHKRTWKYLETTHDRTNRNHQSGKCRWTNYDKQRTNYGNYMGLL